MFAFSQPPESNWRVYSVARISSALSRVALLSITAANMGITLTAATSVIFAELHYTPGIMVQAEDRAHRIGRVGDVNIEYLIAPKTADDWIWSLIRRKLDTLEEAGLGNSASHVTTEDRSGVISQQEADDDWDDDEFFKECVEATERASLSDDSLDKCPAEPVGFKDVKVSMPVLKSSTNKRKLVSDAKTSKRPKKSAQAVMDSLSAAGGFKF